ncbi:MAG: iron ABC transporter permease [Methanomicrobiales archaeon]|jgi:iron complex transport system permease protein|nr:iron ABC transporter permease [Methanomicrobiales archaeon]
MRTWLPTTLVGYVIFALIPVLILISLTLGRFPIHVADAYLIVISAVLEIFQITPIHSLPSVQETIVLEIRLPRIAAALLVGSALSVAGAAYQGMFRNPLVSPDILGVSAGAGFGASLAILISSEPLLIQTMAFACGMIAVGMTWLISRLYRPASTLILVLAGIIVGTVFNAFVMLIKDIADPMNKLPEIVSWLMGSLAGTDWGDLISITPAITFGVGVLLLIRWRINILALGEEEATALGVDTRVLGALIITASTVVTAAAVSISGVIGWVGLVIPHLSRMLVGPEYTKMLPLSAVMGAAFLLIVDNIARTLTSTEVPLGVLTALIGAPFFAYLLTRKKVGWS